ncbi:MAG: LLM class flavin-dependent oxidoreductase [Betaproteobacteria bacterium]|nr:LLM class flavin-dependent oxidoreductase [Betaproteobacteria bacterium]
MDFGIFVPPVADSWKAVKRAEELGYTKAWFYDTQMLNSELFVSMTAAAMNTSKIHLCSGVMIPSNRIAPVAASGLATLNALAPGRIEFGVSTGFTGRRTLGVGPVKLAEMEEYIRIVQGLLGRQTLEWDFEGKRRKIRFLDPDIGAINIRDPIPLHISAFGPKGRKLTAKLGAGWIIGTANIAHGKAGLSDMQKSWAEAGRDPAMLHATGTLSGCVLKEGESPDSERVKAQAGPHAIMAMHSLVEREEFGDLGRPIPPTMAGLVDRYRQDVYLKYEPADARYLNNHRGHLMFLKPEEAHLCSGELIKATTFTAGKSELRERIRELANSGYKHFGLNVGYKHPERLEEWADVFEGI